MKDTGIGLRNDARRNSPYLQVVLRRFGAIVAGFALSCLLSIAYAQEPIDSLDKLKLEADKLTALYKENQLVASSELLNRCTEAFIQLLPSAPPKEAGDWRKVHTQIMPIYEGLLIEGAELKEFPTWPDLVKMRKKGGAGKGKETPEMSPAMPMPAVSFTKDIAPWMTEQCSRCHVTRREGGFSIATFESLMKGDDGGVVLFPGDVVGSTLVTTIESGNMPRGGGKVSPENLAKLKLWIQQGAKFDGPSPQAPLATYVDRPANANPAGTPAPETMVAKPTGKETVSFSRQIAPLLIENCKGCHFNAQNASGRLRFDNFTQLLTGGDSGSVLTPGKGEESLLVKKLRGTEGQRMPAGGRPPLSDENIKLVSKWIDEGASFDSDDPRTNLEQISSKAWAQNASHVELMQKRMERARERWKTASNVKDPGESNDDRFHVIGNISPEATQKLLSIANNAESQVKKLLKISSKEPLIKGGITVFALKGRYDYSEFGKMLESRELPAEWSSHYRAEVLDSYVAIIYSGGADQDKNFEKVVESSLAQQIASLWVSSHRAVPRWFSDGVGRQVLASMVSSGDARVQAWTQRIPVAMSKLENVKSFIDGKINDEDAANIGFAVVRLMNDGAKRKVYDTLLKGLSNGVPFDQAMQKTFGPIEPFLKTTMGRDK
ncbi:MAG: c-type cytochrome domain-containing protein [Pirellula sp.]